MPKAKYKVSLKCPDKTYSKNADSIIEAFEAMDLPRFYKAKTVITVTYGKLSAELFLPIFQMRKLLINKIARQLLQKRLLLALK